MIGRIKASFPRPQDLTTRVTGRILAGIIIVMALSQLISFEKMKDIFLTYLPASAESSLLLPFAAFIVALEVFSVPFLLGMYVSPLMRIVSAKCAWLVVFYVIISGVYGIIYVPGGINTGIFGWYLPLMSAVLALILGIIMLVLLSIYTIRSIKRS